MSKEDTILLSKFGNELEMVKRNFSYDGVDYPYLLFVFDTLQSNVFRGVNVDVPSK